MFRVALPPAVIAALAAGVVNTGLALFLGERLPAPTGIAEAMTVGFFGYGVSLVLFVLALRGLGAAARAGSYFSTAPFTTTSCSGSSV